MKNHLSIYIFGNWTLIKENRFDVPFAMCGRQFHEEREVEPKNVGALQSVPRLGISRISPFAGHRFRHLMLLEEKPTRSSS